MSITPSMAEYQKVDSLAWEALKDILPQREMLACILMNSSMDGQRTDGRIYRFEFGRVSETMLV